MCICICICICVCICIFSRITLQTSNCMRLNHHQHREPTLFIWRHSQTGIWTESIEDWLCWRLLEQSKIPKLFLLLWIFLSFWRIQYCCYRMAFMGVIYRHAIHLLSPIFNLKMLIHQSESYQSESFRIYINNYWYSCQFECKNWECFNFEPVWSVILCFDCWPLQSITRLQFFVLISLWKQATDLQTNLTHLTNIVWQCLGPDSFAF